MTTNKRIDPAIVARAQASTADREAWEDVIEATDKLAGSVLRRVKLPYTYPKEDYITDVQTRIFEKISTFDPDKGSFSTWVCSVAENIINKAWRKHYSHLAVVEEVVDIEDIQIPDTSADLERDVDTTNSLELIETLMTNVCSLREAEVIKLTKVHGYTYAEAAQTMGVTARTAENLSYRGLQKLRRVIKEQGIRFRGGDGEITN